MSSSYKINEEWLINGTGNKDYQSEYEISVPVSNLVAKENPFYEMIAEITRAYQKLSPVSRSHQ